MASACPNVLQFGIIRVVAVLPKRRPNGVSTLFKFNESEALITLRFFVFATLSLTQTTPPAGTVSCRVEFRSARLSFACRVTVFMSVPKLPGSIDVSVIISIVSCAELAYLPNFRSPWLCDVSAWALTSLLSTVRSAARKLYHRPAQLNVAHFTFVGLRLFRVKCIYTSNPFVCVQAGVFPWFELQNTTLVVAQCFEKATVGWRWASRSDVVEDGL